MPWHPPPPSPRRPIGLWVALSLYAVLAMYTVRDMGLVGEVTRSWTHGRPAQVVVAADPLRWADGESKATAGHRWGPLIASQARPVESIRIGGLHLPLAVNQYTGGLADWPARILYAVTGSVAAVLGLHLFFGALVIILVHRFLRFHGTDIAATLAALFLATDWGFHFYRKALGGTEVLLQAAVLLCLWALWSRRWAGGRHGLTALGIGLGLGLLAKFTFALSFAALMLTALLLRKDKPPLRPPLPDRLWMPLVWVFVLLSPLMIAVLHHTIAVPADPHVVSHDFMGMQWDRVMSSLTGGRAPTRQSAVALWSWIGAPSSFLETAAEGARVVGAPIEIRLVGWGLVILGTVTAWRDRHPTPHIALLRFSTVFLVLQVGLVWGIAKDMHHLGMATPVAAIVAGLALDRLMARWTPPKSPARAGLCLLLAVPWMVAGVLDLSHTDAALATVKRPTFSQSAQRALVDLLRRNAVQRVVVIDYELAGVLEPIAPEIDVVHGWALASREHRRALGPMLALGAGHHLLVIPDAPGWTYNLKPRASALQELGTSAGLVVAAVDRLDDDAAILYAVSPRTGWP